MIPRSVVFEPGIILSVVDIVFANQAVTMRLFIGPIFRPDRLLQGLKKDTSVNLCTVRPNVLLALLGASAHATLTQCGRKDF